MIAPEITFGRSYHLDGKAYSSLEEVKTAALSKLFLPDVAQQILHNADAIMAILTFNDSSRPGARGKSKPRKAKAQPELPLPSKDNT